MSLPLEFTQRRSQAYALNEMANVERLRNVEQQVTATVDELTHDFKQRMQSILSDNQLLLSSVEWEIWDEHDHLLFTQRKCRIRWHPRRSSKTDNR